MGFREISLKMPTDFSEEALEKAISRSLKIRGFTYRIEKKSLDARKKENIHWVVKAAVSSPELKGGEEPLLPALVIPFRERDKRIAVIGAGPAGFFAAYALQKAGFKVSLIERGKDVAARKRDIDSFEKSGHFISESNYAFGEGGAGTFSDGKLTSRTKKISSEKNFILQTYIEAGAPGEIAYMTHPHLGSDNLLRITANLRKMFESAGGRILFECRADDMTLSGKKVTAVETTAGPIDADYLLFATGHSSYETYRFLIRKGIGYRNKNFAIGSRVEHPQALINEAQWGCTSLKGVKAAEYRLTDSPREGIPVYSFCMCPGGKIVPAAPYGDVNIVNGMSLYERNSPFANAAIVAGINLEKHLGRETDPLESLEWLEQLEKSFFQGDYRAPASTIADFLAGKGGSAIGATSYPLGLRETNLAAMLPGTVSEAMKRGLTDFSRKLKGFEKGIIMGLESKTSAALQVLRDRDGLAEGFENLYICGEGSGYAGGIISSAADGLRAALSIIGKE
ncbi:NAD(P)/FAD-dependent oxidoreductase [Spirochaeta isovalerica]|uniref:FAD-dependent protein C-terminal domain-containing protein n=1 Tax=Spirochaeta isovalerica TaxID=150 RepID=A0A841REM2_9SPIO|nr:NAD(P)/FAD-dependent oxidoreductase [Spirochaeta isovalerica]MBB6481657.1 hypothetical protein [Spirochaeta isovalerica]